MIVALHPLILPMWIIQKQMHKHNTDHLNVWNFNVLVSYESVLNRGKLVQTTY